MSSSPLYTSAKLETLVSARRFVEGGPVPAYPMNVFLEVSNFCNLRCAMCQPFSNLNPQRLSSIRIEERGFMSKETAFKLESLLPHAFYAQVFGYGEPTLNPDFEQFLRLCGTYETLIVFFTNGMRLTPALCETIVANRVFEITVSFSGSSKADYEAIYVGGVWETVIEGIRGLAAQKAAANSLFPIITVNSLGFRHHIAELEEFVRVMADAGVNRIWVKPLIPTATTPHLAHHVSIPRPWVEGHILERAKSLAASMGVELLTTPYEATAVADEAQHAAAVDAVFSNFRSSSEVPYVPVRDLKNLVIEAEDAPPITPDADLREGKRGYQGFTPAKDLGAEDLYCFEPFYTLYAGRDGKLKPCCNAKPPTQMGDLLHQSGMDAWQGDEFTTVRRTILEGGYPNMCRACVRFGNAHPNHHFLDAVYDYRSWFGGVFGQDLPPEWAEGISAIEAAGSNRDIALRHAGG